MSFEQPKFEKPQESTADKTKEGKNESFKNLLKDIHEKESQPLTPEELKELHKYGGALDSKELARKKPEAYEKWVKLPVDQKEHIDELIARWHHEMGELGQPPKKPRSSASPERIQEYEQELNRFQQAFSELSLEEQNKRMLREGELKTPDFTERWGRLSKKAQEERLERMRKEKMGEK